MKIMIASIRFVLLAFLMCPVVAYAADDTLVITNNTNETFTIMHNGLISNHIVPGQQTVVRALIFEHTWIFNIKSNEHPEIACDMQPTINASCSSENLIVTTDEDVRWHGFMTLNYSPLYKLKQEIDTVNEKLEKLTTSQLDLAKAHQQLQDIMSEKIDETVTAKLTDSSSTLVSKAVGNKLAEKSGDTTVLSNAVIDALKVTDDRSALNQDSEGKALPTNKFKIKGLSNYSLDGHHFIMVTLSGSYDCSSAPTNIIYLPMDGNESSTQAMLLSTAFAFHRTIDVNPDPQAHEVVGNIPVESAYSHNCVLNVVNVN